MEKKLLEKLWNAARDGAYTQNGFTYQNLNEWLRDNPDVALSMSGVGCMFYCQRGDVTGSKRCDKQCEVCKPDY